MPNPQSPQLDEAQAELERLHGIIRAAQTQLSEIQEAIKLAYREHDRTVANLKSSLKKKLRIIRDEYATKTEEFVYAFENIQKDIKEATAEKGVLIYDIEERQRKLESLQDDYRTTRDDQATKLETLRSNVEESTNILADKETQLAEVIQKLEHDSNHLKGVETRLVQAEQTYAERSVDLQAKLRAAEGRLDKIERIIREYDASMQAVRAADAARSKDLDQRERLLASGKRALGQERQEFADEKKRFYQTKAL